MFDEGSPRPSSVAGAALTARASAKPRGDVLERRTGFSRRLSWASTSSWGAARKCSGCTLCFWNFCDPGPIQVRSDIDPGPIRDRIIRDSIPPGIETPLGSRSQMVFHAIWDRTLRIRAHLGSNPSGFDSTRGPTGDASFGSLGRPSARTRLGDSLRRGIEPLGIQPQVGPNPSSLRRRRPLASRNVVPKAEKRNTAWQAAFSLPETGILRGKLYSNFRKLEYCVARCNNQRGKHDSNWRKLEYRLASCIP